MVEQQKKGALGLIKKFYGMSLPQMKEENLKLTEEDRLQLGSAIARAEGIPTSELSFELVKY